MPVPGGYPSRPRFRAVTIANNSVVAAAAAGELRISGTSTTRGMDINCNFGGGSEIRTFGGIPFIDLTMDGTPLVELNLSNPISQFRALTKLKVEYWDIGSPTATLNNANLGNANILLVNSVPTTMTGIFVSDAGDSATFSGKPVFLINRHATNALTITNEGAGSTAANRFLTPGAVNYVIAGQGGAVLVYDAIATRWRILAKA